VDPSHQFSDLQSLRLTQEAVGRLHEDPSLLPQVIATLDHWDLVAPTDSRALRDRWRAILDSGDFDAALALDDEGQALRQASPLARAIPASVRLQIIRACKGRSSNT
jgi:hypothetical protein